MRRIVLDTETTGLSPEQGHRIVEIGCVELHHRTPTGRVFHAYINPERDMPEAAFKVHGLSADFLAQFPSFAHVAHDFQSFIQDSPLIIHNAKFDMKFLQHEMQLLNMNPLTNDVVDTLMMSKKKFPGSPASLDALCRRFNISNHMRDKHGALLDATLLGHVFFYLDDQSQGNLEKSALLVQTTENVARAVAFSHALTHDDINRPKVCIMHPKQEEKQAHEALMRQHNLNVWHDVIKKN